MKVYKFIFIVGFLNLVIPFLSVPFMYKNYTVICLAIVTLGYALIVRAIEKEKNIEKARHKNEIAFDNTDRIIQNKTIEDVVDMVEEKHNVVMSDVIPKKRGRKPRVMSNEQSYE